MYNDQIFFTDDIHPIVMIERVANSCIKKLFAFPS